MLKATVLSARNVGLRLKKRRFLKLILVFVGIKNIYYAYYQYFICNAENKRFLLSNGNTPANISCMYA